MTDKAGTPEQLVNEWIRNAQRQARRTADYQQAMDGLWSGVQQRLNRLKRHATKLAARERSIARELSRQRRECDKE
jgi:hypothetical protein